MAPSIRCQTHHFARDIIGRLRYQLTTDLVTNVTDLRLQGSRGVLFKLTDALLGYTVVAKATIRGCVEQLTHEVEVYNHLKPLQGTSVPVCLGLMELIEVFVHGIGRHLSHMMLVSYGGTSLQPLQNKMGPKMILVVGEGLTEKVERATRALRKMGVFHKDLEPRNRWDYSRRKDHRL